MEIVDETNPDWWTGKCRGKQGLFPSNHVEKIDSPITGSPAPPPPMQPMPPMAPPVQTMYSPPPGPGGYAPNYMDDKQGYRSYGSPYPPPGPGPMQIAPAPPQPVVVQEAPPKKNRFGGLGNTVRYQQYTHYSVLIYHIDGKRCCRRCRFRCWYVTKQIPSVF